MNRTEKLEKIFQRLQKIKKEYHKSAIYYDKLNFRFLIPSIMLTGLSSLASFLSSSTLLEEGLRKDFTFAVAFITSVSTILQTVHGSCEFAIKKVKFYEATKGIDELIEKIYFEISNPNEEDFLDKIEENLISIKENCKFLPKEDFKETYQFS